MKCIKFAFAMLCFGAISCDADFMEPASEKTGFVNTVRKDDVRFKFCLLNEQGEPANVFREGENFSIHFEMENLRKGDRREYPVALNGEWRIILCPAWICAGTSCKL